MNALSSGGIAMLLVLQTALAEDPLMLDVTGTAEDHILTWDTTVGFNYRVEMSVDLQTWIDLGIGEEPGIDDPITLRICQDPPYEPELFYRILEFPGSAFLLLPHQGQEVALIDGVCFAFDLNIDTFASGLPEKIRISKRLFCSVDPWEQIGDLRSGSGEALDENTEFGIKYLRGSAVWIPSAEAEYEVRVEAVDSFGAVFEEAIRRVVVGANQAPAVEFVSGPPNLSPFSESGYVVASDVIAEFRVTTNDDTGVSRVDFLDNGILIGSDLTPPFGDVLSDIAGNLIIVKLYRGSHSITAVAHDVDGATGTSAAAWDLTVTGGNARPELQILSPPNDDVVEVGDLVTITYTASDDPGDGDNGVQFVAAYPYQGGDPLDFDGDAPFDPLELNTSNWPLGTTILRLIAHDGAVASYPQYLRIIVEADTSGVPPTFPERLVANIVEPISAPASNEQYFGRQELSDEFVGGFGSGLQIDAGILLTTGFFASWNGGDSSGETSKQWFDPRDPVLETRVLGTFTADAAVLEFDVNCVYSQLEIRLQFGSEEYIEYVSDPDESVCHNDGLLITVDDVPVSLVPDCDNIIAVNTIRPFIDVPDSYCFLENPLSPLYEHLYLDEDHIDGLVAAAAGNEDYRVEYDGMTVSLLLHALVEPGMHHVRIALADVDDAQWDSGLFIESASVRTVEPQP